MGSRSTPPRQKTRTRERAANDAPQSPPPESAPDSERADVHRRVTVDMEAVVAPDVHRRATVNMAALDREVLEVDASDVAAQQAARARTRAAWQPETLPPPPETVARSRERVARAIPRDDEPAADPAPRARKRR
jgi:hypothetical protein